MQRVYKLQPYSIDKANRSTDYQLLPTNPSVPIISAQPTRGFYQTTWFDSTDEPKQFTPTTNIVQMIEGTEFGMTVIAIDPSNLENPNDDKNLKYVWKRDGAPLYEVNKLNNNRGIRGFNVSANESKKELSGIYTVEISNTYGTTTSAEFIVRIFTYEDHPFFYKNLLHNGNGDDGLDGWVADSPIKTDGYFEGLMETNNFGSFTVKLDKPLDVDYQQQSFHFSKGTNWVNFPSIYNRIENNDNVNDEGFRWYKSFPAALVLNEKKENTKLSSFFPDPSWIDVYNSNSGNNTQKLAQELEASTAYFTRDTIKFDKFVPNESIVKAYQDIDLTDVADAIDGKVFGITELYAQFFCYIGMGLTRYKFKVPYVGKPRPGLVGNFTGNASGSTETNWFILDNRVYDIIGDDFNTRGPTNEYYPEGGIDENTPIELIPLAEDITSVEISYLDENDQVIVTYPVEGPTVEDIFAVKEKFYIPKFLETPIRNAIPFKDITVYYEYDFANTKNLFLNWVDSGEVELQGVRFAPLKPLSSAISTIANPQIFANQLENLADSFNSNIYPFLDFERVRTLFRGVQASILTISATLPGPFSLLLNVVIDRLLDSLEQLSAAANAAEQSIENANIPVSTYIDENVFYNVFYPIIINFLKTYIYILDQDLADNDIANEEAGNTKSFKYLADAKLRLNEYIPWYLDYLANNTAFREDIDGWEKVAVTQYFLLVAKFLEYTESGKRRVEIANRYTNPIKIFDQSYSTVDAISDYTDQNAKWINQKLIKPTRTPIQPDPGAAAFFAVQHLEIIPIGTRKARIAFSFKHTSDIVLDKTPETKNWNDQELYLDLFGNTEQERDVYFKYGTPRCAITSMKYILTPGDPTNNPKYNTYFIPSENVWYYEKLKLDQDVHNSANKLVYDPIQLDLIDPIESSVPTDEQIQEGASQDATKLELNQVVRSSKQDS